MSNVTLLHRNTFSHYQNSNPGSASERPVPFYHRRPWKSTKGKTQMGRLPVLSRDGPFPLAGVWSDKGKNSRQIEWRVSGWDVQEILRLFVRFSEIFVGPLFVEILKTLFVSSRQTYVIPLRFLPRLLLTFGWIPDLLATQRTSKRQVMRSAQDVTRHCFPDCLSLQINLKKKQEFPERGSHSLSYSAEH